TRARCRRADRGSARSPPPPARRGRRSRTASRNRGSGRTGRPPPPSGAEPDRHGRTRRIRTSPPAVKRRSSAAHAGGSRSALLEVAVLDATPVAREGSLPERIDLDLEAQGIPILAEGLAEVGVDPG